MTHTRKLKKKLGKLILFNFIFPGLYKQKISFGNGDDMRGSAFDYIFDG